MNILVTGANGQLGNCIRNAAKGSKDNYIFTDVMGDNIVRLDITDPEAVNKMVPDNDVKAIINCAAYTNVDKAEDDAEFAEVLNADAPRNLANAMKAVDGLLVHVSTDYVFGGTPAKTPLAEDEPAAPTGVYGLTKLHGEQAIEDSGVNALIFRTAWLYSEYGKNFVKTMLNLTSTKPELKVVFDQVGTPTYAQDLADTIFDIVENRKYNDLPTPGTQHPTPTTQIFHFSNEGVCSWFDFTKAIAEIAGNTACDIQPCHSDEFPSKVIRPAYSVLDKSKLKQTFGVKVPYWTDSLKKCIKNLESAK